MQRLRQEAAGKDHCSQVTHCLLKLELSLLPEHMQPGSLHLRTGSLQISQGLLSLGARRAPALSGQALHEPGQGIVGNRTSWLWLWLQPVPSTSGQVVLWPRACNGSNTLAWGRAYPHLLVCLAKLHRAPEPCRPSGWLSPRLRLCT